MELTITGHLTEAEVAEIRAAIMKIDVQRRRRGGERLTYRICANGKTVRSRGLPPADTPRANSQDYITSRREGKMNKTKAFGIIMGALTVIVLQALGLAPTPQALLEALMSHR